MIIYIASSWKNQHAVEMLTDHLRDAGHTILSFVENNHGENPNSSVNEAKAEKPVPFDEWCMSADGERSFKYDSDGAMLSHLVIYVSPSGKDAAAECGMAFGRNVPIVGLYAKGEDFGLMRRMMASWFHDYRSLLDFVANMQEIRNSLGESWPNPETRCDKCDGLLTEGEFERCYRCRNSISSVSGVGIMTHAKV